MRSALFGCVALALFASVALGQTVKTPLIPKGSDVSKSLTSTAEGASSSLNFAFRDAAHLTVEDFGAKGDCTTDDTASFNSYSAYLRNLTGYNTYREFNLGNSRCYIINGSVNLTNFNNLNFDGHGSTIVGKVTGYAVLDAVQSTSINFRDFFLISGGFPVAGIQVGRALTQGGSVSDASNNGFENILMDGVFTEAPVYNRASEATTYVNLNLQNRNTGANTYAIIMDGDAHFPIVSQFASTYNPGNPKVTDQNYPYTNLSFNGQQFIGGSLISDNGPAVWMSNARGHRYYGTYVDAGVSASSVVVIYFAQMDTIHNLEWNVHGEPSVPSDFAVIGTVSAPVIFGLQYINEVDEATSSIFSRGGSVSTVTVHDLNLHVPQFLSVGNVKAFDNGADWTVDGYAYVPSTGALNATNFGGTINVLGQVTFSGSLGANVALPSTLNVGAVAQTAGVQSITIGPPGSYGGGSYAGAIPAIWIAAPPGGGSQATALVSTVGLFGWNPLAIRGGSGYQVGDSLTLSDGNCSTAQEAIVKSIGSGGSVATSNNLGGSNCPASEMILTAIPTSGGHGSGAAANASVMQWRINSATVTGTGSGYSSAPTVSFPASAYRATGTAILSSTFRITGGAATALFNATGLNITVGPYSGLTFTTSGTQIGQRGSAGLPVTNEGAMIDGSGVRVALGSAYAVPSNSSLVRFVQSSTVAASTLSLPVALGDGQAIQFVNYAGAVTALTFTPSVNGWTNGSTLAANAGLRIRWDTTSSTWQREQ